MGDKSSSRRKKKSRAQEEDSDDELWDSEDDDDTIARIQRAHFAQTAAANSRRRAPVRPQRMSHKRKLEAVKNFHNFTKKLKKDTGITIRSLVGNNILELSEFSSEESNSDSDGLSEEGEFVVNPSAVQELNEENESYIDPETGDIVEGKKSTRKSVSKTPEPPPEPESSTPQPKTLSISDIINEDLDLSKNVEIAEVEESELCPEKELLTMKEEDSSSQDFDMKKLTEMDEISVKPVKPEGETANEDEKMDTEEEKKPANPNALNVRRNIREVMDEKNLDASTLAAQRQESERLARVQEQQRIIREVQRQIAINRQNKIHQKTLSLLQGGSSILKKSTGQKLNLPNTVLVKLPSGEIKKSTVKQGQVEVTKVIKPGPSGQKLKKEVVEIVDSSSGEESSSSSSDSDDCIMLSDSEVPPSPEVEEDPGNSGLHVNDSYNTPDEQGRVLINIGHPEAEEDIFLAPQIARIIKPHQIGGVRFLFDNIIESVERFSTSTGFGCILAHSMGLGKTLQIVCFCDIFLRHTSSKTVLCIMPINTLQNWVAEFNMWLPLDPTNSPLAVHGEVRPRNFPIYVLNDSHKTLQMRAKVVKDWKSTGGVLMIGYELYRLLSMKKDKKPRKKKEKKGEAKADAEKDKEDKKIDTGNEDTQDSKKADDIKPEKEDGDILVKTEAELKDKEDKKDDVNDEDKKLLDEMYEALVRPGPDLVICDEGHRIKNSHSNISYALKQMRTKRRIVLTGYPLQNNLLEYWCMVDFVRPNYLGSKTEFCNMFERPIQNGQCIDSTPQDIRLMRYRAHVLHSLLVGFVQRRSHAVLQSTLPQKEEYVLLVRLTPLQRKLYDRFMNEVVRSTSVPNPLKAFAICCKIWNHPDVLYNFLRKRSEFNAAIEEDLDLEEIGGVTKAGRAKNNKTQARRPAKPRGSTKKPAATIQPNITGPKPMQPDSRTFSGAPFTPNGPYGPHNPQAGPYRPDQTSYPPFQGPRQGYYPPNQGFNPQYDNSYYSQQRPYGNDYPNQYPANNPDGSQGYSQNYWGGGSYYSNPGFYGNSQQFGNNTPHQPPSDFSGASQQFRNSDGSSDLRADSQQFANNQSAIALTNNPQQMPGNQPPPDFRGTPQQYPGNQNSSEFRGNSQAFPGGQPPSTNPPAYTSNQSSSDLLTNPQQYPNSQQSPDIRGGQQFPSNQGPLEFRGNGSQFPSTETSQDLRGNQQQYNNESSMNLKPSPMQYPSNQQLPEVRGGPPLYSSNQSTPELRSNLPQYPNNQAQDFTRNSQQFANNQPTSEPRINQQHYPGNQGPDFGSNPQRYPSTQPPTEFGSATQQFTNNQPSSDFRGNSQPYPSNQPQTDFRNNPPAYAANNQPTTDIINNPTEPYNSQQYSSNFNPPRSEPPYTENALQPFNPSNQSSFGTNQRPPYQSSFQNTPGYGEYSQIPPSVSPYPNNQPSQSYSNQNYPNYTGNNAFGNNTSAPYNQFRNSSQNYSDFGNQPPNNNLTDQSVKSDVNDPNYQSMTTEKKCDNTVAQNSRDMSYGNPSYNYPQPNTSMYPEQSETSTSQYPNYTSPLETKAPLGSASSVNPVTRWPITETLKTELDKIKNEDKMEIKSESDGEVKIEDLDTKKIVKDDTKLNSGVMDNALTPMTTSAIPPFNMNMTPGVRPRKSDESETEQELPKKNKRGRPKGSKTQNRSVDGKAKQKANAKAKGRKDRKTSKEKNDDDDDSEESEKEEKLNKEEEMALVKKAEEMTYDWATELLKDYIPGIIENSAKMELFFYILNESIKLGDRLLLFSQSLFTLNLIEDFLERNYIPGTHCLWERNTSYFRLDGSTHALEREKLINEFNANPNIYLFLVSTRAGSLGINLVGANRVIVFDASWNPCHDTQAVCRVYRYGQKKPCFVYRFVMDWCLEKKIYDRQINKQGMADRVVDECNPDAVLSMKEITNLCFDNDEKESEAKDLSEHKDKYIDLLMQGIITLHGKLLSKEPFQHESLLVDRKEKKLSSAEKRLAQRGYELEKKAASAPKPTGAYRTVRAADGSLVQRPVASVRPMQHAGHGARWIPADVWRRQGMTAQEMTLPLDVVIPTNSAEKTNIVLKAGQRVMVLKSPKGIYMQLESGKIIAIKTSLKGLQKGVDNKDNPVGKKVIGTRPSPNIPGSLKNNSAITITSKTGPRPGFNRVLTRPSMFQNKLARPMVPGQKLADIRNRLGELRSMSPIRGRSPLQQGRLLRPNLPGSVSITRIPKETKKTDSDNDGSIANKTSTGSEEDAQVLDSDEEDEPPKEDNENPLSNAPKEDDKDKNINTENKTSVENNATDNKSPDPTDNNKDESMDSNQSTKETQPLVLTTDEKLPSEESLENKATEEVTDMSMRPQNIQHVENPQSNPVEPIERKINLLKNYRHQRPGSRPQTESSLSQLEKTASALNSEGGPDFRKNLDDITQSYSPGLEDKPTAKSKKKKSPAKTPNIPESHNDLMQPSIANMSHSVSNLLGNTSSSMSRKVDPIMPHMVPPISAQPMLPSHVSNATLSQDPSMSPMSPMSPMSSRGQPHGYSMPQNFSTSSLPSMPPTMGHSSTSPNIDVGKIPGVPSIPPIAIPTPTQSYPPGNPLPPERPYGQYPGYGMGFGAYPGGWEYGGYGAAPPYYPAYGAPPYAPAAPPAHAPHPPPPDGYMPPNPQW